MTTFSWTPNKKVKFPYMCRKVNKRPLSISPELTRSSASKITEQDCTGKGKIKGCLNLLMLSPRLLVFVIFFVQEQLRTEV